MDTPRNYVGPHSEDSGECAWAGLHINIGIVKYQSKVSIACEGTEYEQSTHARVDVSVSHASTHTCTHSWHTYKCMHAYR